MLRFSGQIRDRECRDSMHHFLSPWVPGNIGSHVLVVTWCPPSTGVESNSLAACLSPSSSGLRCGAQAQQLVSSCGQTACGDACSITEPAHPSQILTEKAKAINVAT